jgi:hypothetical protein
VLVVEWLVRPAFFSTPLQRQLNVLPSVSYISVSKYLGDNFFVQGSVNKIDKYVNFVRVWQVVIQEEW